MPTRDDLQGFSRAALLGALSGALAAANQGLGVQQSLLQNGNISAAQQGIGQATQAIGVDFGWNGQTQRNFLGRPEWGIVINDAGVFVQAPDGSLREVVTRPIASTAEPVEPEPPKPVVEGRSRWDRLLADEGLV